MKHFKVISLALGSKGGNKVFSSKNNDIVTQDDLDVDVDILVEKKHLKEMSSAEFSEHEKKVKAVEDAAKKEEEERQERIANQTKKAEEKRAEETKAVDIPEAVEETKAVDIPEAVKKVTKKTKKK